MRALRIKTGRWPRRADASTIVWALIAGLAAVVLGVCAGGSKFAADIRGDSTEAIMLLAGFVLLLASIRRQSRHT